MKTHEALLHDVPATVLRRDVLDGLRRRPRALPCKYFYDKTGSLLFDRICELPEYYLTRAETALMERHIDAIAAACGPSAVLIELGSGSSIKTRLLLDRMRDVARYVPVDISAQHLHDTARGLRDRYPGLTVTPVVADYSQALPELPAFEAAPDGGRRVVFFPGSSIGNFEPVDTVRLLARMGHLVGPDGSVLVGADLGRDPEAVHAAYNDRAGVTAAFNLNLLARINRELRADFELDRFAHRAVFQLAERRVEMRLVSLVDQRVRIAEHAFDFAAGEWIVTEHCYKHDPAGFCELARAAGLEPTRLLTDPSGRMGLYVLRVGAGRGAGTA